MKVLHVLDHSIPLHSGYAFRTRNILIHQRAIGIETCHLTSAKQGKVEHLDEEIDGLHFYRCESLPEIYGGIKQQIAVVSSLVKRLYEVVKIEQPDVLHAHSSALNGYAALKVGKKLGIPVVYEVRAFWEDAAVDNGTSSEGGLRYKLTRFLESWVMKKADHVTCICEGLRNDIVARGIAASKVSIIPNAVNIDEFQHLTQRDAELEQELNLQGKKVVGFIGSFYALEGIDLLIKGFAEALKVSPEIRCVIVGGGNEDANLKSLTAELGIKEQLTFTGRVSHDVVDKYYSVIDLLLYPRKSKRITELVTPLKPLEAMAMGREFAASDVGGHRELITHGVTGHLFKADSVEAIKDIILESFATDPSTKLKMKAAADKYVKDDRNWQNSIARYPQIYASIVKP